MSPTTSVVPLADGGSISVAHWSSDGPPVLAIHGLSNTSRLWLWLHQAAPDLSLIAPDLRGRGDSPAATEPSFMRRHAEDLVEVLDALGIEQIDVVGMSMGGFVAMALAAQHPQRVRSVTLLDGGLPVAPDPRIPTDPTQVRAIMSDRHAPLKQTWPSAREYADFLVSQTAPLLDRADELVEEYVRHELTEGVDGGQVRLDLGAIDDDAVDVFATDSASAALAALTVPTRLVHAEWSIGADTAPMYTTSYVEELVASTPALLSADFVAGIDHAALIMSSRGAAISAGVLRRSIDPGA